MNDGVTEGAALGIYVGLTDGVTLGTTDGVNEGMNDGVTVEINVGVDGWLVGIEVWIYDGEIDGMIRCRTGDDEGE